MSVTVVGAITCRSFLPSYLSPLTKLVDREERESARERAQDPCAYHVRKTFQFFDLINPPCSKLYVQQISKIDIFLKPLSNSVRTS